MGKDVDKMALSYKLFPQGFGESLFFTRGRGKEQCMGNETQVLGRSIQSIIARALGMGVEEAKTKIHPHTRLSSLGMDQGHREQICLLILGQHKVRLQPDDVFFADTVENLAANVRAKTTT